MAFAVAEPTGESGDTVAVDDAIGDEAHRPADEVLRAFHSGEPGEASGRHRLQARNPSLLGRGRRRRGTSTLVRFGVIAGQLGRQ